MKKIVIGNWKMNPVVIGAAKKLFLETKRKTARVTGIDVVIAPPTLYLAELRKYTKGKINLGAQDVFYEKEGAYTGEVSPTMLQSVGVTHVIVGHSERRARGETDEDVNKKVHALLKAKMIPVVCVGERSRDHGGKYLGYVETEIKKLCEGLTPQQIKKIIIAYEPIWAIGTGNTATSHDALEMKLFIEKVLTHLYDRKVARSVRIIYGGSVNEDNAEVLITEGGVHGFLVGGASLRAKEFGSIVKTVYESR